MKRLIDEIESGRVPNLEELAALITSADAELSEYVFGKARTVRDRIYGGKVFLRGLIEFTSYCKNDCLYCGIRRSNKKAGRYRMTKEQIMSCAEQGYGLGMRTFVLQGGEDGHYSDADICSIVGEIKACYPDCAVTLSIGEKERASYKAYFDAGADRYLLRHETADAQHYALLHPVSMSHENRLRCLYDLKDIGYQVGCGFMVGSPFQTAEHLAKDLLFVKSFRPDMVGIGPFIPHHDTPFADKERGSLQRTLLMVGLTRLLLPEVLLPSTTALGTIHPQGRELGLTSGANVVMPSLTPTDVRGMYLLYDGKICTGDDAAACRGCIERRINSIGMSVEISRGDPIRG